MNDEIKVKQVTVVSGKGGTGKSTIIAAVAYHLQEKSILADADVDAADLYLIFSPIETEEFSYFGMKKAIIHEEICTKCGICRDSCRFNAISDDIIINPIKCEGCALCYHKCPEKAIEMVENESGKYMISKTRIGTMIHATLNPGEESSGLLVAEVRKKANEQAKKEKKSVVLIDGSPGIGCPVISSLTGSNLAIVVTEPTISGLHDLERILELLRQFRIPGYVIINKFDINEEKSNEIEETCSDEFPVLVRIPFNTIFTKAMIAERSVLEMESEDESINQIKDKIVLIASKIVSVLKI